MSKVKIEKLSSEEQNKRNISTWPIWEKERSRFDWFYEAEEECLILKGKVVVETDEGIFHLKQGDFVTFSQGLKCIWDIKEDIKKHYHFKE
ncbi:cupin domain-containing protein [Natronoflexus pectinivorans]|uniref:(S)-ureidoglycine aminohydrolase cupin domain-containing protein n=1 Tax=Natronoflexus pectinivorans TaxID=682526 RepID=A0A4R2GFM3_9BACT|nr:cupin domain-containing protein [Natronoflexus pectinivorans]TCO06810.1 hypothetical protein EV194_11232 [Natronoflexus pectinivorans]